MLSRSEINVEGYALCAGSRKFIAVAGSDRSPRAGIPARLPPVIERVCRPRGPTRTGKAGKSHLGFRYESRMLRACDIGMGESKKLVPKPSQKLLQVLKTCWISPKFS
jgi:hypothetical protein